MTSPLDEFLSKVPIVSEEEAEAADFVVCMPTGPSPFPDNVEAPCHDCGQTIMHRPHAPKRPKKICFDCMVERQSGGKA